MTKSKQILQFDGKNPTDFTRQNGLGLLSKIITNIALQFDEKKVHFLKLSFFSSKHLRYILKSKQTLQFDEKKVHFLKLSFFLVKTLALFTKMTKIKTNIAI